MRVTARARAAADARGRLTHRPTVWLASTEVGWLACKLRGSKCHAGFHERGVISTKRLHPLAPGIAVGFDQCMTRGSRPGGGGKRGRDAADGSTMVKPPLASLFAGRGRQGGCRVLLVIALLPRAVPASGFGLQGAVARGGLVALRGGHGAASDRPATAGPAMRSRPPPDPVRACTRARPAVAHVRPAARMHSPAR